LLNHCLPHFECRPPQAGEAESKFEAIRERSTLDFRANAPNCPFAQDTPRRPVISVFTTNSTKERARHRTC
jgi:hypothetical protein